MRILNRHNRPLQYLTFAVAAVACLSLTACAKKTGPKITGKREAIFLDDDPIVADPALQAKPISLPAPLPSSSWETASGHVSHAKDPVKVSDSLQKAWSVSVGRGSGGAERLLNGPVAANGIVYTVDTRGVVYATQIQSGKTVWTKDSTPRGAVTQAFSGGLAIEGDLVFVVTPRAQVVMMDATNGDIKQTFELTAPARSAPTVKNGSIYVVNINNQLEVIDYRSGRNIWSHTGIMEVAGLLGGASPAYTNDILVVPYTSGEIYALHPQSGVALWRENLMSLRKLDPISTLFHIKARPVIKGNYVYLIGNGGVMMCLEAASGQLVWKDLIGGNRSPAVSGDYLFMVSNANKLICMNRFNGGIHWVRQLPRFKNEEKREGKLLWAGPILINQSLVLAGSNGQAIVVSTQDGSDQQIIELGQKTLLSPIAVNDTVLFMTDRAELIAYQ